MTDRDPNAPNFDSFEWEDWDNGIDAVVPSSLPDVDSSVPGMSDPSRDPVGVAEHTQQDLEPDPAPVNAGTLVDSHPGAETAGVRWQVRSSDSVFAYVFMLAASVGLSPLASNSPIERYAILWTLLAVAGLAAPVMNRRTLSIEVRLNEIMAGALWGLLLGLPLLLVGTGVLTQTSEQIFPGLPSGAVFLVVLFIMAPVETLFFRSLIQSGQTWLVTAGMAGFWSVLLFFPALNVGRYPMIALIIGTFLIMLNALFSYVRQRNGVMAAWACQVVVSLMWLVLPRLLV